MTFTEPAHAGPADQYLGQRTLVTQVWYPRARGPARPFPLLLFAPGFLQCPGAYSDLLQAWASAGYVVAAVNFPRANCHLGAEAYESLGLGGAGFPRNLGGGAAAGGHGPALLATGVLPVRRPAP